MTLVAPPLAPSSSKRAEHIYPTLTPAQLARITAHGRRRHVERGEVLVQAGEQTARLFVVVAGPLGRFPPAGPPGGPLFLKPRRVTGEATNPSGPPGAGPRPA